MIVLLGALLLTCCGEETVTNKYSGYTARFSYSPVNACPSLYRACTGMGEFCIIDVPVGGQGRFRVRDNHGSEPDYINPTAIQGYSSIVLGLGGTLIIGLPTIAEMGSEQPGVVCYDGVCPYCYKTNNTTKQLSVSEDRATCRACEREYDLNNSGQEVSSLGGRPLYRYAANYNGTGIYVSNN